MEIHVGADGEMNKEVMESLKDVLNTMNKEIFICLRFLEDENKKLKQRVELLEKKVSK
jgi:hypothetical protein